MMENILIVEDEHRIRALLKDYLVIEQFNIIEASNGNEGLHLFKQNDIQLVILDIMMPGLNGLAVMEEIRKTSSVPIILLTAKSQEEDKLLGYELGADDYITKPFSPKVLVAKIKALLKRTSSSSKGTIINFSKLSVNKESMEVLVNGTSVTLTPKEYDLLLYLIENEKIVLSRDTILDGVWGYDYFGDNRVVDTTVKRLREKLTVASDYIVTVRGSGYKFEVKE
ncbi:response regulator transcription factor [Clostridium sp. 'White wine YQ']|uniref:response regulator transcription factor n=1 Tax=Clostridium sp. 'White wine YQ' TaxID=3027474 RepID=UPI002365D2D5|nr:response regulator transcription factor [Clostridium sp. 'White wine YQ']MDD7794032.1 response regulator transcription factor [Clostridium sp. 'White wine YQ']